MQWEPLRVCCIVPYSLELLFLIGLNQRMFPDQQDLSQFYPYLFPVYFRTLIEVRKPKHKSIDLIHCCFFALEAGSIYSERMSLFTPLITPEFLSVSASVDLISSDPTKPAARIANSF